MEWEGKGLQRGDEEKESQEEGEMRARWTEPYQGRRIEWEDQREGKGSGGQGGRRRSYLPRAVLFTGPQHR